MFSKVYTSGNSIPQTPVGFFFPPLFLNFRFAKICFFPFLFTPPKRLSIRP